jgi:hypothetical protein
VGVLSFSHSDKWIVHGKNHDRLREIIARTFVVFHPRSISDKDLEYERVALMVALFPWSILVPHPRATGYINDAQRMVYNHPKMFPLFTEGGRDPNMDWLLEATSYWHFHMTNILEGCLVHWVARLKLGLRPQHPVKVLGGLRMIGKQWRGFYGQLTLIILFY